MQTSGIGEPDKRTLASIERLVARLQSRESVRHSTPQPRSKRAIVKSHDFEAARNALGGKIPCMCMEWPQRENVPCGFAVFDHSEDARKICPGPNHISPPRLPRKDVIWTA